MGFGLLSGWCQLRTLIGPQSRPSRTLLSRARRRPGTALGASALGWVVALAQITQAREPAFDRDCAGQGEEAYLDLQLCSWMFFQGQRCTSGYSSSQCAIFTVGCKTLDSRIQVKAWAVHFVGRSETCQAPGCSAVQMRLQTTGLA